MPLKIDKVHRMVHRDGAPIVVVREALQALAHEQDEADSHGYKGPMDSPIDAHFGLSYANYLVLPRVALASMSPEFQTALMALVGLMGESLPEWREADQNYEVKLMSGKVDPLAQYRHRRLEVKR